MPTLSIDNILLAADITKRSKAGERCDKFGVAVFEARLALGLTRSGFIKYLAFTEISEQHQEVILLALESYDPEIQRESPFVEAYVVADVLNIRLKDVFAFIKAIKGKIKFSS